jgi:hypothetical protein
VEPVDVHWSKLPIGRARARHGWTGSVSQGGLGGFGDWTGAVGLERSCIRPLGAVPWPRATRRRHRAPATRRGGSWAENVIIPFPPSRSCMTILPSPSSPVNLKDALGDIEPNRDSVHDGRSPRWVFSTRQLGAADAVGGRPPSIARSHWGAEDARPSGRAKGVERRPSLRGAKRRSNPAESLGAPRPSGSPGPRGSSSGVPAMTIMV